VSRILSLIVRGWAGAALLAAVLGNAAATRAQIYDMGPLLDAPHPFDVAPAPPVRPSTPPGYGGRLYDMGPMLDAPHPFDVEAPGRPRPPMPPPPMPRSGWYGGAPQLSQVAASASPAAGGRDPAPARANAGPLYGIVSELRFGASLHNTGPFADKAEGGADIDAEILFVSPDFLGFLFSPRPQIGIHVNTVGETSQLWGGLAWTADLWGRFFIEGTFGMAVHDGKLRDATEQRREFGSRILFRESIGLGVLFGDRNRHNFSVYLDHISHGGLFGSENEGMDNVGARYGYRF